jgi:hypothetical protein
MNPQLNMIGFAVSVDKLNALIANLAICDVGEFFKI